MCIAVLLQRCVEQDFLESNLSQITKDLTSRNIATCNLQRLASWQGGIIINQEEYSYDLVYKEMIRLSSSMPIGRVVALVGDYSFHYLTTLFALIYNKCIISPLLPRDLCFDMGNLFEFIYDSYSKQMQTCSNTTSKPLIESLKKQNRAGLVLFSSGSTGKPKAIVHDLDSMLETYLAKRQNLLRVANVFLPNHIAGIDVLFSTISSCGKLIIPKDRNPEVILQSLSEHKVEVLPASPTMLRLLLLNNLNLYDLTSLKLIIYGSERADLGLLSALQEALPHIKLKQSFGTSETNAIKIKNHNSKDGYFKILECDYKIINNELFLRPKSSGLGYINSDIAMLDNEGYFATGDIVQTLKVEGE
ncbi:hypothetical protein LS73_006920, partial [Helicobacter muridarum]